MINGFLPLAEQWGEIMLKAGVQVALVALLVFLFLALTQRFLSSPLRYALLLVVLIKFIVPPDMNLSTGLFTRLSDIPNTPINSTPAPLIQSLPVSVTESSRDTDPKQPSPSTENTPQQAAAQPVTTLAKTHVSPTPEKAFRWSWLWFSLYLCGTGLFVVLLISRYRGVRHIVLNSTLQQDGFLFAEVARIAELLRMKSAPELRISDETDAPFAMGVFHPVIVLPRLIAEQLESDQLTIVIAHELAHIRRRDLWIGWLETLVSLIWWFHPALWWLRKSLRQTREDCCDDLLLANQLAEPERYCETLIEAANRQTARLHEPLVLGFVHREHPAARRIRRLMNGSLFRASRLRYPALFFALIVALVMLPGMRPEIEPVTKTTLEGNFGGWRNLAFQIDADEESAIKECRDLAQTYFYRSNNIRQFTLPETRDRLEEILKQHPQLFYAQYLLSTWHRLNGDLDASQRLLQDSLNNAPVVLTQCYKQGNGDPVAGAQINQIEIECNRVQDGSLNPSLNLNFIALVTDENGKVYLPVYDTVYRTSSQSYPHGYSAEFQSLGWFNSKTRYGILPDVLVWKTWSRPRDFTRTASQSPRLRDATGTDTLKLTSGPNEYRIGLVSRAQADGSFVTENGKGQPQSAADISRPTLTNAAFMDHALITLASPEPSRFDLKRVEVLDSQTKIRLQAFQYAAGFTWTNSRVFHLFSLWDTLPETVDLVLEVYNHDGTAFLDQIPPTVGAAVTRAGATFQITYLDAGNHNGWSSLKGFHGEAQNTEHTSEILFQFTGNSTQQFSLWAVSKSGQKQNLNPDGWFSAQTGGSPVRIMLPLNQIDHFELRPYTRTKTIYFERVQLPARHAPLQQQLPTIDFPIDGQPREFTSELYFPLQVHFKSQQGDPYTGMGANENGFTFNERPKKDQSPDSKCTINWYYYATIDLKHRLNFIEAPNVKQSGSSSSYASSIWGYAGYSKRNTPLQDVEAVQLEILPQPTGK